MGKLANISGGVVLGVSLSQFPEYSQQYVQRLGGAVDELTTVVADFDTSAKVTDQTRTQALDALSGTEFLDRRKTDMSKTFQRQEYLSKSYVQLKEANAFQRLAYLNKFADGQIAKGAWADFQAAIPLSMESLILLLGGYAAGYAGMSGTSRTLRRIKRTKPRKIA